MIPYLQLVVLNVLFLLGVWLFFNIKKQLTEVHTNSEKDLKRFYVRY